MILHKSLVFSLLRSSVEVSAALSSAIQHAMLLEFRGNLRAECLNTRPTTLFNAGVSVKLRKE